MPPPRESAATRLEEVGQADVLEDVVAVVDVVAVEHDPLPHGLWIDIPGSHLVAFGGEKLSLPGLERHIVDSFHRGGGQFSKSQFGHVTQASRDAAVQHPGAPFSGEFILISR